MKDIKQKKKNRILQKVVDTQNCIDGHGLPIDKDGYVELRYRIKGKNKSIRGNRVVAEYYLGDVKDKVVCHRCDNPTCINPKHLFIGTHRDNVIDKVRKNRQAVGKNHGRYKHGYYARVDSVKKPTTPYSELCNRQFTKYQVAVIKQRIKDKGKTTLKALAEELSITYQTIKDISSGRTYKDS
jgi:hypothetical protein